MVVRWKSLMDHVCDHHEHCYHPALGDRRKKWFTPGKRHMCVYYNDNTHVCGMYIGTKACEKLNDVICNAKLLADIMKLSPHQQTSCVESYHSVINHFAPKLLAFSYTGMHCRYVLIYIALTLAFNEIVNRLLIAAMHFNENYGRAQAITKTGAERIRIVYPK